MIPKIIYIMGVSGSGKSTIGKLLSEHIDIPFFDGDDYQPQMNIEKMRSGRPLNDIDRQDWLKTLNKLAKHEIVKKGAIIACSALKEQYRHLLNAELDPKPFWVFLSGEAKLIALRLEKRTGHFMPPEMLSSQFDTLEPPSDIFTVSIGKTPLEIVDEIILAFKNKG